MPLSLVEHTTPPNEGGLEVEPKQVAPSAEPAVAGLSAAQAAERLRSEGPNTFPGAKRRTLWVILFEALREPMFLLLLAAGVLYLLFGDLREGITLFGFVLVTVALTLYQEGKTERAIEALRDLTSPRALVWRDGQPQRIDASAVVRGDVLQLHEGDRISADAWLLQADGLSVDESLLTGEAAPVAKRVASAPELAQLESRQTALARPGGDELPTVFAGTLVVQGHGLAQVTATGARSEVGRIGVALGELPVERTPLQKQTAVLVRNLAWLALALSLFLVLLVGLIRGDWMQALLAGIALAMATLPEEYPMVLTIFPALGARRLAREGVLTRRITAIETLGATTVLCTDKTGTLTENRMTVSQLVAGGPGLPEHLTLDAAADPKANLPEPFHALVEYAILASVADPFDPMERAFHQLGQRFLKGTEHLHGAWRLVQTYALSPSLRAMSHVWATHEDGSVGAHVLATKGAPEAVVDLCHLNAAERAHIAGAVETLAAKGLRVLAVARGRLPNAGLPAAPTPTEASKPGPGPDADASAWPRNAHDFDFEFLGLLGLVDPVRAQVPAAVAECRGAGIRVIMITGDYPATALAIAAQAGLGGLDANNAVLSGDAMAQLNDTELRERIATVSICARVAPDQKLRIVQALKARGEVVAMTGDGVNDAPALRAAHVGVAMGERGTDVARESASLVLLHDDFTAIVHAVRLGRRIFDNLRKAMSYILAVHVPIAGMALLPVLVGWPPLLFPMHIALLELIVDPACSLAFENEPAEPDAMQRPPRNAEAPLFAGRTLGKAALQGLGVLVAVVLAFAWAYPRLSEGEARAFAFTALVVGNLALILSNRSATQPIWQTLRRPNPTLWWVVGLEFVLLVAVLYVPWASALLRFAPMPVGEFAAACGIGLASVLWFEAIKWRRRA